MRTNNLNTREARACLMAGRLNDIRPSWIASQIRESWQRCLSARLNPESLPVVDPVSADQLKELRAQNARLCDIARIEIKNLYSQIAGSHFVIAFATKEAVILDSVADPSFSAIAQSCGILPGSHWEEEVRGTNALGCAAATLMPAVVHASEHFFLDNCHLTCVANPIFDHADRLIGLIDASSDCRSRQINTVALIRMSALHIEAELFRDTFKARDFKASDEGRLNCTTVVWRSCFRAGAFEVVRSCNVRRGLGISKILHRNDLPQHKNRGNRKV